MFSLWMRRVITNTSNGCGFVGLPGAGKFYGLRWGRGNVRRLWHDIFLGFYRKYREIGFWPGIGKLYCARARL